MTTKIRNHSIGLIFFFALAASLSVCLQLGLGLNVVCCHVLAAFLLDLHLRDLAKAASEGRS